MTFTTTTWRHSKIALQFAGQQARSGKLTLVLSDILQSGLSDDDLWRSVAGAVRAHGVTRLIGIGRAIRTLEKYLSGGIRASYCSDTGAFLHALQNTDFHDETILLKGARPFEFEK
jgi:alanine racemase